jgi:hypothetical protein
LYREDWFMPPRRSISYVSHYDYHTNCSASVWFSNNGERLGTLSGHSGAIFSIDVDSVSFEHEVFRTRQLL